ncbi:hypothetical protein MY10362_005450 [Beauveria mimosiformis]
MSSWELTVLNAALDFKKATQSGDWSKFVDRKSNPKFNDEELKKLAKDFPDLKPVLDDAANYHEGITNELQSVTDDLESGGADKPTAIEKVRAQIERLKIESIANIDTSTNRVVSLIGGLSKDQQEKAAEFWEALLYGFAIPWSEVMTQVGRIFEHVVEWTGQVWELVRSSWNSVKSYFSQVWGWLEGIN